MSSVNFDRVLGDELRKTRLRAKMTQEAVAGKARITREYLSQVEGGDYKPTVEVLLRLAKAMGVKAWRILKRVEEKN